MHVEDVIERPIYLAKSGPSMAPVAGRLYSEAAGLGSNVIVCDTGGTTFDVSLVSRGAVRTTRDTWVGGQFSGDCLGLSSVDVRSIGSGGGSIAWIDDGGLLRVGPHSAGSVPGPACYANGGLKPTVTDAAVVLGYIDPDYFLGGRMKLDVAAARRAIDALAKGLSQDAETTAAGILSIANEHMVRAIEEITVNEGISPKDSAIAAGGGSAGISIMEIAAKLGCRRIVLPRTASAFSACGAQFSDFAMEETVSFAARTDAFDHEGVNAALARANHAIARFGNLLEERGIRGGRVSYSVEARYLYEAWEIEVPLASGRFLSAEDVAAFEDRFHAEHERVFATNQPGQPVEILVWKARLSAPSGVVRPAPAEVPTDATRLAATRTSRGCFFRATGIVETPVFHAGHLSPGDRIDGPAIIEEETTTIVVYPGMSAEVDSSGSYVLDTGAGQGSGELPTDGASAFDPVTLAVMANRLDGIVREMSNTLLRTGRSAVINQARDFSCAIVTDDHALLAIAEGVPVHVFGAHLQTAAVTRFHDPKKGDAYLHNDPYLGNTHPADHTIIVPVFCDGELMFYTVAKAHQADIGNAQPTTYAADAVDVYNEGALIFPCVRVHQAGVENDDIIRMCRARIRVPDQWYGDFLAGIGAARIGERKLEDFVRQYGKEKVRRFIGEWFNYSRSRMESAISMLPAGTVEDHTRHDPTPSVPEGIPVGVSVTVSGRRVTIDLRDNPDCYDCGLNLSEACSTASVMTALFNCLEWDIPKNAGSFSCVEVLLRENCCVGIPRFPHSCSMATTNLTDRLVNVTQSAIARFGDGFGLAHGGNAMGAPMGVISGRDFRHADAPYINQIFVGKNGGPGGPASDGWVTYVLPNAGGVTYRDSIELDELKHPVHVELQRIAVDTGGAGRFRGAPSAEVVYGPKRGIMTVVIPSDGHEVAPQGVWSGKAGAAARTYKIAKDGSRTRKPNVCTVVLEEGEFIHGIDCGGGGYGDPLTRDPERVLEDVREGWVSSEAARRDYGVVTTIVDGVPSLDLAATEAIRQAGGTR
jgi:N-methylhydantoinase B